MLSLSGETATNIAMTLSVRIQNYIQNCVKSFEIDLQMESKIDPETIKIQAPGTVLGALLDALVEIFGEVGAKMGPRWSQDGPRASWAQDGP